MHDDHFTAPATRLARLFDVEVESPYSYWFVCRPRDAVPTLGSAGAATLSPTVILTTYAAAEADIGPALAAILAVHPWEVPVIELAQAELLIR
jgi:hypothetical protein